VADVVQLPTSALRELVADPDAVEIVDCDVPEPPSRLAARRPWFGTGGGRCTWSSRATTTTR
jgi:hypothetical protein